MKFRRPARSCTALLLCAGLAACATLPPTGTTHVVRSVNVVDTVQGQPTGPRDVFIAGDRIAAVEPAGRRRIPDDATVIDGSGRWLMPGLWDMHAHWYEEATLPVFLMHGVTGLRQMRGYPGQYATRARGLEGTPASPRIHLASALVDGPKPASEPALKAVDEASARDIVRLVAASRADFLKVYDQVPAPAYRALVDEARRLGVRVEGHVPIALGWEAVSALGQQRSFEHLHSLMVWASADPASLHARWLAYHDELDYNAGITAAHRRESAAIHHAGYDQFDPDRFASLAAVLRENETWQTPTCVLWQARKGRLDPGAAPDPRDRLVPRWLVGFWQSWWPADDPQVVAEDFALNDRRIDYCLARTRDLHAAGVPLLAGSDTIMPFVYPGSSLHEELALMVQAGLPRLAALQTATLNPARFIGRDDLGVVRAGALADLVLLQGDPLADIANTQRIEAVAIGGRWIDAEARAAGLARIERIQAAPAVADRMAEALGEGGLEAAFAAHDALCPAPPEQVDCGLFNAWWALAGNLGAEDIDRLLTGLEARAGDDADLLVLLAQERLGRNERAPARRLIARALEVAPGDPWMLQFERGLGAAP
mgnify:FL=1